MKVTGLVVGAAMALSGCGAIGGLSSGVSSPFSGASGGLRGSQTEIGGVRFRSRITAVTENDRGFTVATRGAARDPAAAAEAGRVEAVEYCIRRFGGSDILWSAGPDQGAQQLQPDGGGTLLLAGTCITR